MSSPKIRSCTIYATLTHVLKWKVDNKITNLTCICTVQQVTIFGFTWHDTRKKIFCCSVLLGHFPVWKIFRLLPMCPLIALAYVWSDGVRLGPTPFAFHALCNDTFAYQFGVIRKGCPHRKPGRNRKVKMYASKNSHNQCFFSNWNIFSLSNAEILSVSDKISEAIFY